MYKNMMKHKRNNRITVIKYVCTILVLLQHTRALTGKIGIADVIIKNLINIGYTSAVSVFFILSGYFFYSSLLKKNNNITFIKNKIIRLLLPLAVMVIASIFIGSFITSLSFVEYWSSKETYLYLLNIICIPQHFLPGVFTNNPYTNTVNGSLWTMTVVLLSYISCFIANELGIIRRKIFNLIMMLVTVVLCVFIAIRFNNTINSSLTLAVAFYAGVWFKVNDDKIKYNVKNLIICLALISLSAMFNLAIYFNIFLLPYIVLFFVHKQGRNQSIAIPDYSFEIYLWAFPVQQFLVYITNNNLEQIPHVCLAILISLIFAIITTKLTSLIIKATTKRATC